LYIFIINFYYLLLSQIYQNLIYNLPSESVAKNFLVTDSFSNYYPLNILF